jgi:hypothetical protein
MDYNEFHSNFYRNYQKDNKGQRIGQFFMNELHLHKKELYIRVPADLDPWHNDSLIGQCMQWVADRWDVF